MKPFRRSYTAFLLVLTFGMAAACWSEWKPLRRLETVVFDRLSIMRTIPGGGSVVLVAIDDDSIRRKGGWPWSRGDLATVIDRLSAAGARAIGLEMLYPEKVADHPIDAVPGEDSGAPFCDPVPPGSSAGDQGIGLRNRRDGDHRLMAAVRSARNLVLPLRLIDAHSRPSDPRIDAFIRIHSLPLVDGTKKGMASVNRWAAGIDARWFAEVVPAAVVAPYPDLCGKAGGLGHVSGSTDADGLCRFDTLLIPFRDRLVPSFALQLAIKAMDGDIRRLSIHSPGPSARSLEIGTARIGSDRFFRFYIDGGQVIDRFEEVSFVDVQEGRLGDEMFRDRVVLIGPTSAMITELLPGPLGQRRSSVQYSAAAVDGLIRGVSIQRPPWAIAIELGALLYVGFFLWAVIPRVQKRIGGLILGAFLIVWTATVVTLFKVAGLWLFWFPPVILALSGGGAGRWAAANHCALSQKRRTHPDPGRRLSRAGTA